VQALLQRKYNLRLKNHRSTNDKSFNSDLT